MGGHDTDIGTDADADIGTDTDTDQERNLPENDGDADRLSCLFFLRNAVGRMINF